VLDNLITFFKEYEEIVKNEDNVKVIISSVLENIILKILINIFNFYFKIKKNTERKDTRDLLIFQVFIFLNYQKN